MSREETGLRYRFFICDVFTTTQFGGNQLAVLPEAEGLNVRQMQQIAREFNYSESTFVMPSDNRYSRSVRIFTPTTEIPFAGHPNIGTAFVLANDGMFGQIGEGITVTFHEAAGTVTVTVQPAGDGRIWCELAAPQALSLGETVDATQIAGALSLDLDDIETSTHLPQVASVGLPFLFVELASREALGRARVNLVNLGILREAGVVTDVHLYVRSHDEFDIRARMFAPFDGVPEDPATGSANCALVALLTHFGGSPGSSDSWRIAQGVEMARPSILEARADREGDAIKAWIAGYSVLVGEGFINSG
jgi:trans-2,3-dihydro-3-hydroxyanthranilate isomerase